MAQHEPADEAPAGERSGDSQMAERSTPPLFGMGLIAQVPDEVIVRAAKRRFPAFPTVHGRVHRMSDGRIGRFGWKAQTATLEEFVLTACANELGLEVPGHHQAISPLDPRSTPKGLDLTAGECNDLVAYVRMLPAPTSLTPSTPSTRSAVENGRRSFQTAGCATCHVPRLGEIEGIYSDLSLHDMGERLTSRGSSYGDDSPSSPDDSPGDSEWRTPPLWGFRDSAPYLHDGRARTLDEAVAMHGGEAAESVKRFFEMPDSQRADIRAFLETLVAPPSGGLTAAVASPRAQDLAAEESVEQWRRDSEILARRARRTQREQAETRLADSRRSRLDAGKNLERLGKAEAAIAFYQRLVSDAPESAEGRLAADRIKAIRDK